MTRVAVLHPGQMGAVIGRILAQSGHDVGWLPRGRSAASGRRAAEAGLRPLADLHDRDVVLSICPPTAALATAGSVTGFSGLYLDANAVSPRTAAGVAAAVEARGGTYVDGGIVGPPPDQFGTTRLYLSGDAAGTVQELFGGTALEVLVLPGDMAASALKMAYASWSKTTAALVISVREVARRHGVEDALVAEWARSQPGLAARHVAAVASAERKGWRWEAEMREVSSTFAAAGEPTGFGDAAAEQFSRWPRPTDD